MMKLQGETALITCGTSGLGKKLAEILLAQGCKVALCSRTQQNVDDTVIELQKTYGNAVMGAACDVSRFDDINAFAKQTIQAFGSLRILIANAGIAPLYGPFRLFTEDQIVAAARSVIDTNLIGTINSIGAVLAHMVERGYDRIITVTGGGDKGKVTNLAIYGASKGGICSFSQCLAEELKTGKDDITLNIFQPGPLKTNLNHDIPLVKGWQDEDAFHRNWNELYNIMNLDISRCCKKVLPYIIPRCKKSGKTFLGFSLLRMISKFGRIKKAMNLVR